MTVTWLLHSALTWVESSKLREERGERGRCWHEEDEDEEDKPDEEEEVDKPEEDEDEHFSLSPLFTLRSGVERREKAPESEDREDEEEEWQAIVLSSSTFTSS